MTNQKSAMARIKFFLFSLFIVAPTFTVAAPVLDLVNSCNRIGEQDALGLAMPHYMAASKFKEAQNLIRYGSADDIVLFVKKNCLYNKCRAYSPWLLLNSPRLEVKSAAHLIQENYAEHLALLGGSRTGDWRQVLEEMGSRDGSYSPESIAETREILDKKKEVMDPWASNAVPFLCQTTSPKTPGCMSALYDLFKIGLPQVLETPLTGDMVAFTMVDALKDLLINPKYLRGVALAALTIQARVESPNRDDATNADLFSDLFNSFKNSGLSDEEALDGTWKVLGFYGARGASMEVFASRVANHENAGLFVGLSLIGSGLGYLDGVTLPSGHPYSLPKSYTTHCNYGRPYHFWMAAFMAHELVKRNHPAAAAFMAVHLAGEGYEMTMSHISRNEDGVLASGTFSDANTSIRGNIIFDDAGAAFGAYAAWRTPMIAKPLDLDARYVQLHEHAKEIRPLNKVEVFLLKASQVGLYAIWKMIIQPDYQLADIRDGT